MKQLILRRDPPLHITYPYYVISFEETDAEESPVAEQQPASHVEPSQPVPSNQFIVYLA
jgi:hypothetical protein